MATTAKIAKEHKKPKFKVRLRNRCHLCGRPRAYMRKFALCRLCFRKLALDGDVTGVTKGRGYTGVVKRHGFSGFPASHGTHEYFRHGGSIGNRSFPGRVFKNKRMPGHMGLETVTIQKLKVVDVDLENNLLLVLGAVPGHNNAIVTVKPSVKAKGKK